MPKPYPPEFRRRAVELARTGGKSVRPRGSSVAARRLAPGPVPTPVEPRSRTLFAGPSGGAVKSMTRRRRAPSSMRIRAKPNNPAQTTSKSTVTLTKTLIFTRDHDHKPTE
ncbi:hypothetical protein GCM10010402_38050 [Actinomadura luteofluorescens]